jgi:hypothetical protein
MDDLPKRDRFGEQEARNRREQKEARSNACAHRDRAQGGGELMQRDVGKMEAVVVHGVAPGMTGEAEFLRGRQKETQRQKA